MRRILRACQHHYDLPITAYLSEVFVSGGTAIGVVFGHREVDQFGRFDDGRFLRTSSIRFARKEGRFWVLTTLDARYVIASFKRLDGRHSFRALLASMNASPVPPTV
ncbi:hypothetical protein C1X59_05800 [Pseudomonas sp. FW215-R2]|nr:hypothetical protein C1X59_05800 [Pseudomonas sp. FW215-R2]PMX12065.1 hypothetical protein C1X60_04860 [Pseudomonas sp. FW215-L1]PMX25806.1 hypothetical protein C1X57_03600 [Pseudomonas sp. FW215-E1]PNA32737.1 hypothetical protein C1X58_03080 [Pseudomonas sp. FW215-R4]